MEGGQREDTEKTLKRNIKWNTQGTDIHFNSFQLELRAAGRRGKRTVWDHFHPQEERPKLKLNDTWKGADGADRRKGGRDYQGYLPKVGEIILQEERQKGREMASHDAFGWSRYRGKNSSGERGLKERRVTGKAKGGGKKTRTLSIAPHGICTASPTQ